MLKYVRIAVTALSLMACVLLIALWVRSYWWVCHCRGPFLANRGIEFNATLGRMWIGFPKQVSTSWEWDCYETPIIAWKSPVMFVDSSEGTTIPYWLPTLIASGTAVAPWFAWSKRFSLRTLLIATTLVALGMGIVVALS
jgi:hypothetical protein